MRVIINAATKNQPSFSSLLPDELRFRNVGKFLYDDWKNAEPLFKEKSADYDIFVSTDNKRFLVLTRKKIGEENRYGYATSKYIESSDGMHTALNKALSMIEDTPRNPKSLDKLIYRTGMVMGSIKDIFKRFDKMVIK